MSFIESKNEIRPLPNNEETHIIPKNITYARGENIMDGFRTFISFKGVQIIDLNTRYMKLKKTNQETQEANECNELIKIIV